jgi:hydrogenase-4 component F
VAILVAGMFAVTACPPFGPFFSELQVVRASCESGQAAVTAILLVGLLLAFFGLLRVVLGISDGRPLRAARATADRSPETPSVVLPPLLLLGLSLWLGLFTPPALREAWTAALAQVFPVP